MRRILFAAVLAVAAGAALCPARDARPARVAAVAEFPDALVPVPQFPARHGLPAFLQLFDFTGPDDRVFTPLVHAVAVSKGVNWSAPVGARVEYFDGRRWKAAKSEAWRLVHPGLNRVGDLTLRLLPAAFGPGATPRFRLVLATELGLYAPTDEANVTAGVIVPKGIVYLRELRRVQPFDEALLRLRVFTRANDVGAERLWERWDDDPAWAPHLAVPGYAPWPVRVDGSQELRFAGTPPRRSEIAGSLRPLAPAGIRAVVRAGGKELARVGAGETVDLPALYRKVIGDVPPMRARGLVIAFEAAAELAAEVPASQRHLWKAGPSVRLGVKGLRVRRGALVNEVTAPVEPVAYGLKVSALPRGARPKDAEVTFTVAGKAVKVRVSKDGAVRWLPGAGGGTLQLQPGKAGEAATKVVVHVSRCKDRVVELNPTAPNPPLPLEPLGVRVHLPADVAAASVRVYLHRPGAAEWGEAERARLETTDGVTLIGPEPELHGWLLEAHRPGAAPCLRLIDGSEVRLDFARGGPTRTVIINDHREPAFASAGLNDAVRDAQEEVLRRIDDQLGGAKGTHRFLALVGDGRWPIALTRKPFLACKGPLPQPPVARHTLPRDGFWASVRDAALVPELRSGGRLRVIVVTIHDGALGRGAALAKLRRLTGDADRMVEVVPLIIGPSSVRPDALARALPGMVYLPVAADANIDGPIAAAVKAVTR